MLYLHLKLRLLWMQSGFCCVLSHIVVALLRVTAAILPASAACCQLQILYAKMLVGF